MRMLPKFHVRFTWEEYKVGSHYSHLKDLIIQFILPSSSPYFIFLKNVLLFNWHAILVEDIYLHQYKEALQIKWKKKTTQQSFNYFHADLLASLLSLCSRTPLSARSPLPMPPTSLSRSFSPCRREQVRLRRRREGGDFESVPTASPVVTVETSLRSSSFSVRINMELSICTDASLVQLGKLKCNCAVFFKI